MATQGGGLPENPEGRTAQDFGPGGSGGHSADTELMRQNPRKGKRNMPRVQRPPQPKAPPGPNAPAR
jgi:hypothetical protein